MTIRIGVVGDLHTHWDDVDVAQLSRSDYDLLFFIGDLGGGTPESSLRVARSMARLEKQALVMPGNNDIGDVVELSAELSHRTGLQRIAALRTGAAEVAPVSLCGYSTHRLTSDQVDVTLVAARPHSLGGSALSFPEFMAANYGIASMEASTQRLRAMIDAIDTDDVVFFAHNGPTGLGDQPHDMWGCDFKPDGGDWGDPDLEDAVEHARACGKRVLAVVAGHMHLRTRQGQQRPWISHRGDTVYVNAARVPRVVSDADDVYRHHVSLVLTADGVQVEERFLPQSAG